ncbi:MAG: ribose 5-phosphate isomerase B [Paramuribaculum sp.]|nr:ribose 5-phosphate isomerase B [Paramuribaculum sp.]
MTTFASNPSEITLALCSDHAGYELKCRVIEYLGSKGYKVRDFGTHSVDSCDYPDFAHPAATAVERGECQAGIAMCGTGNGIAMTLNKHAGVRAALCWAPELAALARGHNNANILVMPARFIDPQVAIATVDAFLESNFEGGRHERRIAKIPVKQ